MCLFIFLLKWDHTFSYFSNLSWISSHVSKCSSTSSFKKCFCFNIISTRNTYVSWKNTYHHLHKLQKTKIQIYIKTFLLQKRVHFGTWINLSLKEIVVSLQSYSCLQPFAVQGLGMQPQELAWPGSGSSPVIIAMWPWTSYLTSLWSFLHLSYAGNAHPSEDHEVKQGKSFWQYLLGTGSGQCFRYYFHYRSTFRLWT